MDNVCRCRCGGEAVAPTFPIVPRMLLRKRRGGRHSFGLLGGTGRIRVIHMHRCNAQDSTAWFQASVDAIRAFTRSRCITTAYAPGAEFNLNLPFISFSAKKVTKKYIHMYTLAILLGAIVIYFITKNTIFSIHMDKQPPPRLQLTT